MLTKKSPQRPPQASGGGGATLIIRTRQLQPLLLPLLLLLLASGAGAVQQAISIDSDQAPTIKSESNLQPPQAPSAPQAMTQLQQASKQQVAGQATSSAGPLAQASAASGPQARRPAAPSPVQAGGKQHGGRARRPTQQAARPAANQGQQEAAAGESGVDSLQEEMRRLAAEYSNTPPLFVTATRDFFVDVARYPLGSKLATMQALDLEGDRLEYSLRPAKHRDASPYFAINATSGELRLAHKRIPLLAEQPAAASEWPPASDEPRDSEDAEGESAEEMGAASGGGGAEKPSVLYFLNVVANDGKISTTAELLIHVFNSTSFGTKAPVQLTVEGGRWGASAMRAKTSEFLEQLYRPASGFTSAASALPDNSSTLVFPSFVNPSLVGGGGGDGGIAQSSFSQRREPLESSAMMAQLPGNELGGAQQAVGPLSVVEPPAAHRADQSQQRAHVDAGAAAAAAAALQQQQQPLMLSLVIIICSCFTVALVLLIFVVPISVKRLKRRLKNMELQHEQLSQKTSSNNNNNNGSSIACSSSAHSTHSMSSSMATSGGGHLASLSQFTLSNASERSGAVASQGAGRRLHSGHHQALGRQSSLDSAITSAHFAGSSLSYQTQHYHPPQASPQQLQLQQLQLQQQQQLATNGLNRINNGAIVNPIYLHGQPTAAAQQQQHQQHAGELNNIYCPIDDDFYSTINNELEGGGAMIVGQTADSRHYFASGCAPQQSGGGDNQPPLQRDNHSRSSSRSSTRSLARFLSLPARHWSHQQQQQQQQQQAAGDVARKRSGGFLAELEYHFGDGARPAPPPPPAAHLEGKPAAGGQRGAQTIARATHIGLEQQARLGKRARRGAQREEEEHCWELERHKLQFISILDEGQFGLVWRCKLKTTPSEPTVAVKTLKSSAAKDEREREELLAEIEIMKRVCGHPNVVRILHCCTRDISQSRPILLVMEHVELGKLQSFLERSRAAHNYATTSSLYTHASCCLAADNNEPEHNETAYNDTKGATSGAAGAASGLFQPQLTSRELIKFIYHAAKGMEYISANQIVHRDLASRNILISGQRVCKIGDFGMARHVANSCDVYERRSRNAKIPVRWMAPEVLLNNSFTTKSDVYSFGILMWEIVTLGSTPYANLKMEEIIGAVARAGARPSKPDYCHALLYNIMSACWSAQPDERPSFGALVRQLDELLLSTDEYIELDQYPDHNYYNIAPAPGELL